MLCFFVGNRKKVCTQDANTIADGLAVREPSVEALSYISRRVSVLSGSLRRILFKRPKCCYQILITWPSLLVQPL